MLYFYRWEDSTTSPLPIYAKPLPDIQKKRERAVAIVVVLAIWGGGCSDPNDSKNVFFFLYTSSSEKREIDTYIECCIGIVCFVAVYALIGLCLLYRPVYLIWHLHCTPQNISPTIYAYWENEYILLYTLINSHLTCRCTFLGGRDLRESLLCIIASFVCAHFRN